jgi:hypothetical protein
LVRSDVGSQTPACYEAGPCCLVFAMPSVQRRAIGPGRKA